MSLSLAVSFIHFLIGILALVFIWHFGFRPYLLDKFRSDLFNLRDDLFDYAAKDKISFNDPAYGALREWINALIRMAHRVTFLDTLVITRFTDQESIASKSLERKLNRLNQILKGEEGDELQSYAMHSLWLSSKYLFLRSPVLWVILPIGLIITLISEGSKHLFSSLLDAVGRYIEKQIRVTGGAPS